MKLLRKETKHNTIENLIALILAILPIMTPYALVSSIPVNLFLIILGCIFLLLVRAKIDIKKTKAIWFLWFSHSILSMLTTFITPFNLSLLSSLIVGTITVLGIGYMWSYCSFDKFIKHANRIGWIASFFLFFQAMSLAFGITPLSGRILGLRLLDYSTFVQTTWGFRLNSIFQEPSYFAIYILPLFAFNLKNRQWLQAITFLIALLLSSSSLGIIGALIIICYFTLTERVNISYVIGFVLAIIMIHLLLMNFSDYYSMSIHRSLDKMSNIFTDSGIRLSGQLYLFDYLPTVNKAIGVGINQLQNYFLHTLSNVANYSNSFIITLINTGILGLTIYILFLVYIGIKVISNKTAEYFIIFVLIAAVDYFIYNPFFYYVLTYIFLNNRFLERKK